MSVEAPIFIDFEASGINGYPIQVAYGTCEADLQCHLRKNNLCQKLFF
jgi:hypothetical protein